MGVIQSGPNTNPPTKQKSVLLGGVCDDGLKNIKFCMKIKCFRYLCSNFKKHRVVCLKEHFDNVSVLRYYLSFILAKVERKCTMEVVATKRLRIISYIFHYVDISVGYCCLLYCTGFCENRRMVSFNSFLRFCILKA